MSNTIILRANTIGFTLYDMCCYVTLSNRYDRVIITIDDMSDETTRKKLESELNFMTRYWESTFDVVFYSDIDSTARIYFDRLIILGCVQITDANEYILSNEPHKKIGKRLENSIMIYPHFYEMIIGYVRNVTLSYGVYGSDVTDNDVNCIDNITHTLKFNTVGYRNMTYEYMMQNIGVDDNITTIESLSTKVLFTTSVLLLKPIIHRILSLYNVSDTYEKITDISGLCHTLCDVINKDKIDLNRIPLDDFVRVLYDPVPIFIRNQAEFSDDQCKIKPDIFPRVVRELVYIPNHASKELPGIGDESMHIKLRYIGCLSVSNDNGVYYADFVKIKKKKCKHKYNWLPCDSSYVIINGMRYVVHNSLLDGPRVYVDGMSEYVV